MNDIQAFLVENAEDIIEFLESDVMSEGLKSAIMALHNEEEPFLAHQWNNGIIAPDGVLDDWLYGCCEELPPELGEAYFKES